MPANSALPLQVRCWVSLTRFGSGDSDTALQSLAVVTDGRRYDSDSKFDLDSELGYNAGHSHLKGPSRLAIRVSVVALRVLPPPSGTGYDMTLELLHGTTGDRSRNAAALLWRGSAERTPLPPFSACALRRVQISAGCGVQRKHAAVRTRCV